MKYAVTLLIIACSTIANSATVKVATEVFVTNYVERAAPKKKIAMFIIPLNNASLDPEMSEYFFNGFELKASTNNFAFTLQDSQGIQFYSDSGVADDYGSSIRGLDMMKLFACDYRNEQFRSYNYITNTSVCALFDKEFESVIAIVDTSCLRRNPSGDWLSESNENLSWCFRRHSIMSGVDQGGESFSEGQYWHPIMPVRWFSKMPNWAVIP